MTEVRLKIALTALLVVIDTLWIVARGFTFDLPSLGLCLGVTALMASIAIVYTKLRPDVRLATMSTETGFLIAYSAAASVFSYLVTTLDFPLIDPTLVQVDHALGFDWYAYVGFVNARPWLGMLSSAVYQTTLAQIALSVVVLTMLGRTDRTRELTLTVMVSSFFCVVISGLLPAAGALAYHHPLESFYMQNQPVVDLAYKQVYFDIRNGLNTHLGLTDVHGLIAFPSYHVGLSIILILAFRGMRGWFWPIVALNLAVILSTPIDGGHHLSDGLGGIVLALACSAAVVKFRARLGKTALSASSGEDDHAQLAGQKT